MTRRTLYEFAIFSIAFLILQSNELYSQTTEIYLHDNWLVKHRYGNQLMKATVPGTIHTDLLSNSKIPDPFLETNEKLVQWIDTCTWDYQSKFLVNDLTFSKAWLHFDGLDTYADVYVNGKLVLKADNMFREWEVDCSSMLKLGENDLLVRFHPPSNLEMRKASALPYTLPDNQRVFTRKAAYQYGWDWGPKLVTCGMWKPVKLVLQHGSIRLNYLNVEQISLNESSAVLHVLSSVSGNLSDPVHVQVFNEDTNELVGSSLAAALPSDTVLTTRIQFNRPKLWWCNGLGEPFLYTLRIELSSGNDKIVARKRIGLRTIELIQEPDSLGKSFYFKLNGRAVFIKGANIIPLDNFLPRISNSHYVELVNQAKKANMNMLRVWGGGVYADDSFYDACDENGILVWQDFMFANSMYPGDSSFYENVKHEVRDQVIRLRSHPSLAIWCGNNEISEAWFNWGWQKQFKITKIDSLKIWNDYQTLFEKIIPETLTQYDSKRAYWPSSPKHGWGRKESLAEGDSHYWGVWWGLQPFEVYESKVGRFMSEYGFQGMLSVNSVKRYTNGELSFDSDAVKHHQKHPTGYQTIEHYRKQWFQTPSDFDNYSYQSQLLQAEGMKVAIEVHRRSMPYCMGTLFWQLNDCWPVTSWSSIDYYGRKKAIYFFAKRAFSNSLLSIASNKNKYEAYFVNDNLQSQKLSLVLKLIDLKGDVKWKSVKSFQSFENRSQLITEIDSLDLVKYYSLKNSILVAEVRSAGNELIASNYLYFVKPKDLMLEKGNLVIRPYSRDRLLVKSNTLVKNVFLDAGDGVIFSDNYFDVIPNQEVIIEVQSKLPLKQIVKSIKVRSLADTYE